MAPDEESSDEWVTLSQTGVRAICQRVCTPETPTHPLRCVDQLGASPRCILDIYAHPTFLASDTLKQMSRQELKRAQEGDAAIGPTIQAIKYGKWPEEEHASPELSQLKREMKDGLLHRLSKRSSGEVVS